MATLLTRDEAKARQLDEDLKETFFGSAEKFVELYSEGWINRTNSDIQAIAQQVVDTYQNVQLKGRDIVFVSQTEVMVNEVIDGLAPWKHLTKIKRALNDAYGDSDGDIYLTTEQVGYILRKDAESGDYTKAVSERFFRSEEEAARLYQRYSSFYAENPNPSAAKAEPVASDDDNYNPVLDDDEDEYGSSDYEADTADDDTTDGTVEYRFKVSDFTGIDDSFITDIYDLFAASR